MPGYDPKDWRTHVDRTGYVGPRLEAQFRHLLKTRKGKGDGTVVFLAGGNGAGKSTVAAKIGNSHDFTIDSTLGNLEVAKKQIDAILANGQTPEIHFVYRTIGQALEGIAQLVKNGGHIVSPLSFANSHVKSRENLRLLSEAYGDKIHLHIYDNSADGAPEITLNQLEAKEKPDHARIRESANYYLGHLREREEARSRSQGGVAGGGAKGEEAARHLGQEGRLAGSDRTGSVHGSGAKGEGAGRAEGGAETGRADRVDNATEGQRRGGDDDAAYRDWLARTLRKDTPGNRAKYGTDFVAAVADYAKALGRGRNIENTGTRLESVLRGMADGKAWRWSVPARGGGRVRVNMEDALARLDKAGKLYGGDGRAVLAPFRSLVEGVYPSVSQSRKDRVADVVRNVLGPLWPAHRQAYKEENRARYAPLVEERSRAAKRTLHGAKEYAEEQGDLRAYADAHPESRIARWLGTTMFVPSEGDNAAIHDWWKQNVGFGKDMDLATARFLAGRNLESGSNDGSDWWREAGEDLSDGNDGADWDRITHFLDALLDEHARALEWARKTRGGERAAGAEGERAPSWYGKAEEDMTEGERNAMEAFARDELDEIEGANYDVTDDPHTLFRRSTSGEEAAERARREYDEVVARYTNPDGTKRPGWMRAPNGKPTRLTERQWVQVRTPSFKKWFGDWERVAVADAILGDADIASDGALLKMEAKAQRAEAKRIYDALKAGGPVETADGRSVHFLTRGFKEIKSHSADPHTLAIVPILKEVVASARYIGEGDVAATAANKDVKAYHIYARRVNLGDGSMVARIVIREDKNGNQFYDEESTSIENVKEIQGQGSREPNTGSGPESPYAPHSLAEFFGGINHDSVSKVVDENGEPLVVYHGSPHEFSVFDRRRIRNNTRNMRGFFFTTNRDTSGYYGKEMPCFLNVRRPLVETRGEGGEETIQAALKDGSIARHDGTIAYAGEDIKSNPYLNRGLAEDGIIEIVVPNPTQIKSATDNTGAFDPTNPDIRFSVRRVTPEEDAAYMDAVRRGDMEAAEKMERDAVARAMPDTKVVGADGKPMKVYHGSRTGANIKIFRTPSFFSDNRDVADMFKKEADFILRVNGKEVAIDDMTARQIADELTGGDYTPDEMANWGSFAESIRDIEDNGKGYGGRDVIADALGGVGIDTPLDEITEMSFMRVPDIYECYVNITNPLEIDFKGKTWGQEGTKEMEAAVRDAAKNGYDGVIVRNIREGGFLGELRNGEEPPLSTDYIPVSPNQIKLADAVTRDDAGNVIPLSQRFDQESPDIRFSVRLAPELRETLTLEPSDEATAKTSVKAWRAERKAFTNRRDGRTAELKADWTKIFSEPAKKKSANYAAHDAAANRLDTLFENGVRMWDEPPRNGSRDIRAYAKYGCPFEFGGETYLAKITVKEYADGKATDGFYSIEEISVEKIGAGGINAGITSIEGHELDPGATAVLKNMLQQTPRIVPNAAAGRNGGEMRFSIAGARGASALGVRGVVDAEAMEKDGRDRTEIWRRTGWWRGADGKWRFELPPVRMKGEEEVMSALRDGGNEATLGKLLDAPKLFAAYPQLKGVKVVFSPEYKDGIDGWYAPALGEIRLFNTGLRSPADQDEYTRKAYDNYLRIVDSDEYLRKILEDFDAIGIEHGTFEEERADARWMLEHMDRRIADRNAATVRGIVNERGEESVYQRIVHEVQHAVQMAEGFERGGDVADADYWRIAGEVEARNAARRDAMTPEERAATPPWETEDVPADNQIMRGAALDGARFSIRRDVTADPENATLENTKAALKALSGVILHNYATGINAQINAVQRDKIVSNAAVRKSNRNGFTTAEHNAAASIIDRLWKHAELSESRADNGGDPNIASIKRFVSIAYLGDKEAFAYITAKESTRNGHRIYSIELEKLETLEGKLKGLDPSSSSATREIIARLRSKVNAPANENRIAGLGLEEETESILRTQASGDNVLTASDYSKWSTAHSVAQPGAGAQGPDVRFSIPRLYTGSAADYEKPSLHYVGMGEGNQVYGWGLYASDRRGVAEGYAKTLARDKRISQDENTFQAVKKVLGNNVSEDALQSIYEAITGFNDWKEVKDWLKRDAEYDEEVGPLSLAAFRRNESALKKVHDEFAAQEHLYEQTWFTDRAPGDESHLLKWYDAISDSNWDRVIAQAEKEGLREKLKGAWWLRFNGDLERFITDNGNSGDAIYERLSKLLGGPQSASEFLARAGIDGVKYPVDSYGKAVKDGDEAGWNYVSFRDDNIRVDHKWRDGWMVFRRVTDKSEIARLENDPKGYTEAYASAQMIDGKVYSPMAAYIDGKLTEPFGIGEWQKSEEHPELADASGNFKLDKTGRSKDAITAKYNPYWHSVSLDSPLNDQFSTAYARPNLVMIKVRIPNSDLLSGYRAENAKDPVGALKWKSGDVTNALKRAGKPDRTVFLSRYRQVLKVLSNEEAARLIARQLEGVDIRLPANVVTPAVRDLLVGKYGVRLGEPTGNANARAKYARELREQGVRFRMSSTDIDPITLRNEIDRSLKRNANGHYAAKANDEITFSEHVPHVLYMLGAKDARIYTKNYTIRKIIEDHSLLPEQVAGLVKSLENPVAVLSDDGGSYVVLTDIMARNLDGQMKPVMIWMRPDSKGNYIASAYSRTLAGEKKYVNLINAKRLLYLDKNKVAALNLGGEAKSSFVSPSSGNVVKTPEDLSSFVSVGIIPQTPTSAQGGVAMRNRRYTPDPTARLLADALGLSAREAAALATGAANAPLGVGNDRRDSMPGAARDLVDAVSDEEGIAAAFDTTRNLVGRLFGKGAAERWRALRRGLRRRLTNYLEPVVEMQRLVERRTLHRVRVEDSVADAAKFAYSHQTRMWEDAEREVLAPLYKEIAENGLDAPAKSIGEGTVLHELLLALHGPAFNRMISERTDGKTLDGSGASTAFWLGVLRGHGANGTDAQLLGALARGDYAALGWAGGSVGAKAAKAVSLVRELTDRTRDVLERSGRLGAKQRATWEALSPFYVPMRFDQNADDNFVKVWLHGGTIEGGGYARNYAGGESRHAFGHRNIADNPIVFAVQQHADAIQRATDNDVRRKLADMVRRNEFLGHVVDADGIVDMGGVVNPRAPSGFVGLPRAKTLGADTKARESIAVGSLEQEDNIVAFKEGGDVKFIVLGPRTNASGRGAAEDRALSEAEARLVGRAVKKTSLAQVGHVLKFVRGLTRTFGQLRTTLSPEFLVSNFLADNAQAAGNVYATFGAKGVAQFERGVPAALASARRMLNGKLGTSRMDAYAREMREGGGLIGGLSTANFADVQRDVEREVAKFAGDRKVRVLDFISHMAERMNAPFEVASRLSAYAVCRENGMTRAEAAKYAREVTVDFNQKGEWTPVLNALYAFSNASLVDMERSFGAYAARRGLRLSFALVALGFLSSMLGYWQDDPDDAREGAAQWKDTKDYVKQNKLGFRAGTNLYSVPIRGVNRVLYYAGHKLWEVLSGRQGAGEAAWEVGSFAASNLVDPIGDAAKPLQAVTPSVLRPGMELLQNESFSGAQIYREPMNRRLDVRSAMGRRTTPGIWHNVAEAMNAVTGGNRNKRGAIDVQPEVYQYVYSWLTGSAGNDIARVANVVKDIATWDFSDMEDARNVPFVRRFTSGLQANTPTFREKMDEFNEDVKQFKDVANEDPSVMADLRARHPFFGASPSARRWLGELTDLGKAARKLMKAEMSLDGEDRKAAHRLRLQVQAAFIHRFGHAPEEDTSDDRAFARSRDREAAKVIKANRK